MKETRADTIARSLEAKLRDRPKQKVYVPVGWRIAKRDAKIRARHKRYVAGMSVGDSVERLSREFKLSDKRVQAVLYRKPDPLPPPPTIGGVTLRDLLLSVQVLRDRQPKILGWRTLFAHPDDVNAIVASVDVRRYPAVKSLMLYGIRVVPNESLPRGTVVFDCAGDWSVVKLDDDDSKNPLDKMVEPVTRL